MYLETERLIIRSLEPGDEEAFIDMASDGSLGDIFGDWGDCRKWMNSWIREALDLDRADDPHGEYLAYAITEKSRGILLGSVGCSRYQDLGQVGVTFFIGSPHRGKGYAPEAVAAYAGYFFTRYGVQKLIATVREDNAASRKAIEKAGFLPADTRMYRDINDAVEKPYVFYALYSHGLGRILYSWGLQEQKVEQIYDTAWQVGEGHVLKVYREPEALERNLKMLQLLSGQNLPVARVVPTKDGSLSVSQDSACYFLTEKLPGSPVTQPSRSTIRLMGQVIARLHRAFRECEPSDVWDNSLLDEMNGWVRDSMEADGWHYISREAYTQTISDLAKLYGQLPVQLIHRDIHFGNFLFAEGVFSGYIDFDLSQRNIRIFDLCYFLLGLLAEEDSSLTEEDWFLYLKDLFEGYESVLELTSGEKEAVPCVMECIELLFTAYFANEKDQACARNAMELYGFVRHHRDRILNSLRLP